MMTDRDQTEKVRQEIMRFRELLDIMQERLTAAEHQYTKLFEGLSPQEVEGMKEKDVQWKLAETMLDDTTPLRQAVGRTQFDCRELMKAFEELYGIIIGQ